MCACVFVALCVCVRLCWCCACSLVACVVCLFASGRVRSSQVAHCEQLCTLSINQQLGGGVSWHATTMTAAIHDLLKSVVVSKTRRGHSLHPEWSTLWMSCFSDDRFADEPGITISFIKMLKCRAPKVQLHIQTISFQSNEFSPEWNRCSCVMPAARST